MPDLVEGTSFAAETELSRRIRTHVLHMTHRARSSHVATSFSMAEILALMYSRVLRVDPREPKKADRDRFILSKGHGCAGLYAVLAERGFFPVDWLDRFYLDGSPLMGHVSSSGIPGVEVSTGALGHGLPLACGLALAAKRDRSSHRVFAVLSDGECDEGSTWEAALFAPAHQLDNLVAIIDYNKIQSLGHVQEVLDLEPFADKWSAFGWAVREVDGHSLEALWAALRDLPLQRHRPACVIAHTVKGKGVSFMEDNVLWHYRPPSDDELARALQEIGPSRCVPPSSDL